MHRSRAFCALVSLNGALLPLHGLAGQIFSPLAKLLAANRLVPLLFAWRADDDLQVRRLVASTGSRIDEASVALYRRLVSDPAHAAGALAMMANWDLRPLAAELPRLRTPVHLLAAAHDRTLPPTHSQRVAALLPQATLATLPALGHIAHKEDPQQVYGHVEPLLAGLPAAQPAAQPRDAASHPVAVHRVEICWRVAALWRRSWRQIERQLKAACGRSGFVGDWQPAPIPDLGCAVG